MYTKPGALCTNCVDIRTSKKENQLHKMTIRVTFYYYLPNKFQTMTSMHSFCTSAIVLLTKLSYKYSTNGTMYMYNLICDTCNKLSDYKWDKCKQCRIR